MDDSTQNNIQHFREQIDRIDLELLELLNQRADCAIEIGKIKLADSLSKSGDGTADAKGNADATTPAAIEFYKPEREAQVFERIRTRNKGPIPDENILRLFKEIMSISLSLERPLKVGYLGPKGSFTHAASTKQFGHAMDYIPADSIPEVFKLVSNGTLDFGVVPIENSTAGMIHLTQDCLIETPLSICSEVHLKVEHNLLSKANNLDGIECVYGHPQALAQCQKWLDSHLSGVKLHEVSSNSRGAAQAEQNPKVAAIASKQAAGIYNLNTLVANIEDIAGNATRFYVVSRLKPAPSGNDKTSLFFSVKQTPGSLVDALTAISKHDINMTLLTSRPSPVSSWDYVFFVEMEGHIKEAKVKETIDAMQHHALFLKVLGSFPISVQ